MNMSDIKRRAQNSKSDTENLGEYDTKRDFLEKSGVSNWMRDVMSKILANRPDDAVGFLAQYFITMGEKCNRLNRAYHCLMLTDHHQPMFANNVATAYEILSTPSGSKTTSGLTGSVYRDVLNLICSGIPTAFHEQLFRKIGPRDIEVIYPSVFHSGVVSAFVLIEFLKQSEELFELLKSHPDRDFVDHELASTLLQELQDALAVKTSNPVSILTAGSRLTNEGITETLLEMYVASQSERRQMMTKEEFLQASVDIYLKEKVF